MTRFLAGLLSTAALVAGCASVLDEERPADGGLHLVGDGPPGDGPSGDRPDGPACVPDPAGESCNGVDDDCDGETDEGFEGVGESCTRGSGACERGGTTVCAADGSGIECSAVPGPPGDELCGTGIDEDCDGAVDEDFEGLGTPCDGPDDDLCADGILACSDDGLALECTDGPEVAPELCNGFDDDCDPATLDGADDPQIGQPCDGADGDLCLEGTWSCGPGGLTCGDTSGTTAEICNSADDDCDGVADDGFNLSTDVQNCGACGNVCTNPSGTTACSGGACAPSCSSGWLDCDGDPDDGCERHVNDSPACSSTSMIFLGSIAGDTGSDFVTDSWYDEEWDRVTVLEADDLIDSARATVELTSPPGADFDLYLYCYSCGGTLIGSSTLGAGQTDVVHYRKDDSWGSDDTRDIVIEIRYWSASACDSWSLRVTGNTSVSSATCS